jgi:ammonium transporter, Amt family
VSAGDNAWMMICAALVLMMTIPGLALFYGGLVRARNVLTTVLQSFILAAVVTLIWAIYGYSVAFAEGSPFLGGTAHIFLRGVGATPNPVYAATIPHQTFMIYQLMFAVITPALITGAFAERIKFSAMLIFTVLWTTFIYLPLAHMVWGVGGLFNAAGGRFPALDFAGGTVVHVSSGVTGLICAIYLGKRIGFGREPMNPHNLVMAFTGACLLWIGWFGFNAGSALSASGLATNAFVTTHFAAAAAALAWLAVERLRHGKPSVLGAISGAVAGLVAITPACGFVTPMSAILIGLAAGVVCCLMVTEFKTRFRYDDSLDVFGIHGAGGALGAVLTGVFATAAVNPIFRGTDGAVLPVGLMDSNPHQVVNQLTALVVAALVAAVGSLLLLTLIDRFIGVRSSAGDEILGLDESYLGEVGYDLSPALLLESVENELTLSAESSVEMLNEEKIAII